MEYSLRVLRLSKRHALKISNMTRSYSDNIFLFLSDATHTGIGECDPGCFFNADEQAMQNCERSLSDFLQNTKLSNLAHEDIMHKAKESRLPMPAQAALDMALWDLFAKRCSQPCYRIFGLGRFAKPTSITLGLTKLENIYSRLQELLTPRRFRYLKIKLGSPEGMHYDQEAFSIINPIAKDFNIKVRVDANGGWNLKEAKIMCRWLADRGVEYVEQPLAPKNDEDLKELFNQRPLPIIVDESCHVASDIPRLYSFVDGINIKLMKCGGLSEALRMVATAKAHGLKIMIGCMSESSIALSAAASISSLFDYVDLDSAFNLALDPAFGPSLIEGVLLPSEAPGHGASLC